MGDLYDAGKRVVRVVCEVPCGDQCAGTVSDSAELREIRQLAATPQLS